MTACASVVFPGTSVLALGEFPKLGTPKLFKLLRTGHQRQDFYTANDIMKHLYTVKNTQDLNDVRQKILNYTKNIKVSSGVQQVDVDLVKNKIQIAYDELNKDTWKNVGTLRQYSQELLGFMLNYLEEDYNLLKKNPREYEIVFRASLKKYPDKILLFQLPLFLLWLKKENLKIDTKTMSILSMRFSKIFADIARNEKAPEDFLIFNKGIKLGDVNFGK